MPRRFRLTRREALRAGLAAAGGLVLPACSTELPPTYGNLLRMGDALTYASHRALLSRTALVREYSRADLSPFPAIGTTDPAGDKGVASHPELARAYADLRRGSFADFRVAIEGRVARPRSFSLAELKRLASRTQITRHLCEEGWSAIGEWTGTPLGPLLRSVGILPSARYVTFETFDQFNDNIDLLDAFHPQTILAYGMNGRDLPVPHGGPLRLRVETQVGYKSVKFVRRILVHDQFDDLGSFGSIQNGWSWYAGI